MTTNETLALIEIMGTSFCIASLLWILSGILGEVIARRFYGPKS